jgi:hypothetical protein
MSKKIEHLFDSLMTLSLLRTDVKKPAHEITLEFLESEVCSFPLSMTGSRLNNPPLSRIYTCMGILRGSIIPSDNLPIIKKRLKRLVRVAKCNLGGRASIITSGLSRLIDLI